LHDTDTTGKDTDINIFILHTDPAKAARDHCDRHVVKMMLETAQLLCSVHEPGEAPYRRTHYNHPCSVWTRASRQNYDWLVRLGLALADEYAVRYGKVHKSRAVVEWAEQHVPDLSGTGQTPFVLAMPEEYKGDCPVRAYRAYYRAEKGWARWDRAGNVPEWFTS